MSGVLVQKAKGQTDQNRLRNKVKLHGAMFLVSLAGPGVFAGVFTQFCLSFGWQIACAGSTEAWGKD